MGTLLMKSSTTHKLVGSEPSLHLKRTGFIIAVVWTIAVGLALYWHALSEQDQIFQHALIEARQALNKDIIYRKWASGHGGIYVAVTEETPPNPYLQDLVRRDVTTTDGQQLTLVNPAYMTRQVNELGLETGSLRGHLISLNPIRPENTPDAWEDKALRDFERGESEVYEVVMLDNTEQLRLIKPLWVEASCLECHAKQGYKLDDLLGGLSLAVPLLALQLISHQHWVNITSLYAIVWLLGLLGLILAMCNIRQQIRKHEKLQRVVRKNEGNLRRTLNAIGEGIISINLKHQVLHLNPVAEKLTGWLEKDATGRPLTEVFNIVDSQTRLATDITAIDPARSDLAPGLSRKALLIATDGSESMITYNSAVMMDADGTLSGTVIILSDETETSLLQEELLKARKLEAVAILAGGLAHDFNNLLTGLFGNIQLALMKLSEQHPAHSSLVNATMAFDQGISLTSQLLTFSRGGLPLLEETSFSRIIQNSIRLYIDEGLVTVDLKIPENLWPVRGDHVQLYQACNNLFSNAIEAMPNGGSLHIEAENIEDLSLTEAAGLTGKFVKLMIQDEGVGLTEHERGMIFDAFYTTKEEGRGLGLAVTHRIITKHNGHIQLDSEPGVGTVFNVYLPAAGSKSHPPAETLASQPEALNASSRSILIVDDEEMIRDLTREMLESVGYQVDTAAEGQEAIEKFIDAETSGKPFDAVIMDLTMPTGMDGKTACEKLLQLYPGAQIIASSGYFADATMADFDSFGFTGRISKPFRLEFLQKELSRVISLRMNNQK